MLKSIYFENYKAFHQGKIKIKPITILLGANSSGKSSITQLLLLLKQTFNHEELYDSALKLNGPYINLGEDDNLIKDKDYSNILKLEFKFDATPFKNELKDLKTELYRDAYDLFEWLYRVEELISRNHHVSFSEGHRMPFDIHEDTEIDINQIFKEIGSLISKIQEYKQKIANSKSTSAFSFIVHSRRFELAQNLNHTDYLETFHFINKIINDHFRAGYLGYEFKYSEKDRKLIIQRQYIKSNKTVILDFYPTQKTVASDIINKEILQKYSEKFKHESNYNLLQLKYSPNPSNRILRIHNWQGRYYDPDIFLSSVIRSIDIAYRLVKSFFAVDSINYVGPLRAYPQRYYLLDESNINNNINYSNGKSLAEVLKKNKNVNKQINNWLEKFGLSVSVREFKDIIHNIVVKQSNLDLNITDVGFGISQVLPILVQGFMSKEKSLTIIEQPEIHLHPKMQADLGDLFTQIIDTKRQISINLASNNAFQSQKRLLIETHSEYMIKRLRRRISENALDHRKLGLYFIEPRTSNKNAAILKEVKIGNNGVFEWPKDFYITEYEDDMAFFKNISKNASK